MYSCTSVFGLWYLSGVRFAKVQHTITKMDTGMILYCRKISFGIVSSAIRTFL